MQAFFKGYQESLIRCFYLAVALWVLRGRVQVFYLQFAVEILVYSTIKLWPIFNYNRLGYSESAHNVFPYKLNDLFVFDGCEGFGPYPFAEVIGGN